MDTLTPHEVTAYMVSTGANKAQEPYHVAFFKAWMAGWMVCFGAMLYQLLQGGAGSLRTDYPSLINLLGSLFFPVGLIMIVLTGQELLTAHLMYMPMALLKRRIKAWELPLNWTLLFFGNLAGALSFAALLGHHTHAYSTAALVSYAQQVAEYKVGLRWGACLLRGVGCNFLVCVAVWLGAGARETASKIMGIHFPVFLFVFLGFEHVIVNMYYVPIGMILGADVTVGSYIVDSMIPALIGNIIGALLVGIPMLLFWEPLELPFLDRLPGRQVAAAATSSGPSPPQLAIGPCSRRTR